MVYQWKSGSRVKADAQASGELMERLSASEEGLTAESLLNANKPKNAPLHDCYEWDNKKAAHNWRLHQSRNFINSIAIVTETEQETDEEPEQARAFFIADQPHEYEPIHAIIQQQTKYEKLLETAKSELRAFMRKYRILKELQPVFAAIEEVQTDEA